MRLPSEQWVDKHIACRHTYTAMLGLNMLCAPSHLLSASVLLACLAAAAPFHPPPQDVANAMWALAVLQVRPSNELLSFLLIRLQSHFSGLKPREVATTLWALSQLQAVPPSSWLQECLLRQVGRQQWQDTQPRHWVMCLTACAHLKQVGADGVSASK